MPTLIDTTSNHGVTDTVTLTMPTHAAGDFALVYCHGEPAGQWTNPLTGWNTIFVRTDTGGTDREVAAYWRKLTGSEPASYDFTRAGGALESAAIMEVWRDVDDVFLDVTYVGASHSADIVNNAETYTNPAITTVTNDAVVILLSGTHRNDLISYTQPSGYTLGPTIVANDRNIGTAHKTVATAGTETPGAWSNNAGGVNVAETSVDTIAIRPAGVGGSAPTISGVTTVNAGGSITITVDSYTGTLSGTINGTALTSVTGATSTTITANVPLSCGAALGSSVDIVVTDDNGSSTGFSVTFNPPSGWSFVTLTSIAVDSAASLIPGIAIGDQIGYEDPAEGSVDVLWDVDGELSTPGTTTGTHNIDYRVWDASASYVHAAAEVATLTHPPEPVTGPSYLVLSINAQIIENLINYRYY